MNKLIKENIAHWQYLSCICKNVFYLCLLTTVDWFIDWHCHHKVSCFHFPLTLYLVFIFTRGPGRFKKFQTLKCWFVGNLDYRKTSSMPGLKTGTIFMFLCLNIEDLFEVVLFKNVFQHLSPTPAQVTNKTEDTNSSCCYFPCSSHNKCLRYLSRI